MERLITFESKSQLEEVLSKRIAQILQGEIAKKGQATLLLSGGSTPTHLYQKLGEIDLDWSKVHVGLVDERFVPQESPYSNERLIRENLMTTHAAAANFHPLVLDASDYDANLGLATLENEVFEHPDVVVLGMGDDGHTASLFPTDEASQLASHSRAILANTNAPVEPIKRITFCGPTLKKGTHLFLMIIGKNKMEVLLKSEKNAYPIHPFIDHLEGIYYSENV